MAAKKDGGVTEEDIKQIVELVENLRLSNAALQTETEMFERYISRLDPRDLVPQVAPESLGAVSSMEMGSRVRKPKARRPSQERSQRLTLEQKCDIGQREVDEMRDDLKKLKESSEKVVHNYKATIEEADIRLAEVKKASYEFDRDVAKTLQEKQAVMMAAEKVSRYIEDRMKSKDTLIEKLRLKNAALRVQKRKLQLRQKEEMGEALQEVDFQQLKIENSQYLEQIDQRNQDLLRLKLQTGNTLQVLNSYKKKLQSLTLESKPLSSDIASREEMIVKIEEETQKAEEERAKAEAVNRKLRAQLADFHVPHVLGYVTAKASHTQLEQSVRAWERKVEITEMVLKTHTKAWNKLCAAAGATTLNINI
ncbi:coiled-coil domain-containing protein 113 [Colossoma macropomum]|uniref:coiled-coil domain-containing protein 113 n=1 Tax=Colossoma macropomum TaxID=42526 RepID=UPI001864963A|nr:coiled-coil domain-containing protein 113 [Colossoma macropomum]